MIFTVKKITAVLAAITVLCLILSGCKKDESATASVPDITLVSSESSFVSSEEAESSEIVSSAVPVSSEAVPVSSKTATVSSEKAVPANTKEDVFPYSLSVNRTQNIVIAYSMDTNGEYTVPARAMVCSVGLDGGTPKGNFNTMNKYIWRPLVGGVYGQYATRITGSILFHSVPYFSQNKGDLEYAEYNKLGSAASLGCVRLSVIDAKWIYDNCPLGTQVKIYDSDEAEPLAKPTPAKIDEQSAARGWDPTDPDPDNLWNKQ